MSRSSCHFLSSSFLCQHLTQSLLVGGLLKPSMNHLSSVCPQSLWANGFSHVPQYFGSGSPRGSGEVASRPAASLTSPERSVLVVGPVSSSGFSPSETESSEVFLRRSGCLTCCLLSPRKSSSRGGCRGGGEAVGGPPPSATVELQSLSSTLLLSWPSTCEKLERWLVCLGTTLINLVDVGPKGGGGGAGGGMGVGLVGAEQRAAASDAW